MLHQKLFIEKAPPMADQEIPTTASPMGTAPVTTSSRDTELATWESLLGYKMGYNWNATCCHCCSTEHKGFAVALS